MAGKKNIEGLLRYSAEIKKLTSKSIQEALIILMHDIPYEKISITKLCEKAGVSRMGFYDNFTSKDEVIQQIAFDIHNELMDEIGHPYDMVVDEKWYLGLFEFVSKNSDTLKIIFSAQFYEDYMNFIQNLTMTHPNIKPETRYPLILWTGAIVNLVLFWLRHDMQSDPKEMAHFCMQTLSLIV